MEPRYYHDSNEPIATNFAHDTAVVSFAKSAATSCIAMVGMELQWNAFSIEFE